MSDCGWNFDIVPIRISEFVRYRGAESGRGGYQGHIKTRSTACILEFRVSNTVLRFAGRLAPGNH